MANPTTNFGWQMPQNTDLVKDLPADFEVFGQAVDTDLADLKGGTTGQVLSKTTNTDLDFTWVTPTDQTPLTTKGDLFTFTTVDARLGVGADGTVLTADSAEASGLKWATAGSAFSGVFVRNSGNQSINNATNTTLTFDTEVFDTDAFHSTSTNTSRLTVPSGKAGYYWIWAKVDFDDNQTGRRTANLALNGSNFHYFEVFRNSNGGYTSIFLGCVRNLIVGDYVEVQGYQSSGGALNVMGTVFYNTQFGMNYLGA